jgi:hypothetical protein
MAIAGCAAMLFPKDKVRLRPFKQRDADENVVTSYTQRGESVCVRETSKKRERMIDV